MSMKKTDLEKNKMIKAASMMKAIGIPDRFGKGSVMLDRKEQRKLDQAAGLIPFACKLPCTAPVTMSLGPGRRPLKLWAAKCNRSGSMGSPSGVKCEVIQK